jgi:hypothetical protein
MTSDTPSKTALRDRRGEPRQAVSHRVQVTIDGRQISGQIVNLSPSGALVLASAPVRLGQQVIIEIPVIGPVAARVQRVTSIHFAVSFEPPLPGGIPD